MKIKINQAEIKELRFGKGWTQEKLAEVSGVHTRTVQRIENDGTASIQSLNSLAQALAVEPETLQWAEKTPHSVVEGTKADPYRSSSFSTTLHRQRRAAEKMQDWLLSEQTSWAVLAIGAFLLLSALFIAQVTPQLITQSYSDGAVTFNVLLPGTAIGFLLMLGAACGISLSRKARAESAEVKNPPSSEWIGWMVLFIGTVLLIAVILVTEANLNRTTIFYLFLPGITLGLLLMGAGSFIVHLSKERKTLSRLARSDF